MYKDGAGESTIKNTNMVVTRIYKVWTAVASSGTLYTVLKFCLIRCSDLKKNETIFLLKEVHFIISKNKLTVAIKL